ncbi:alkylhalidase-like protein [Tateyamaria omphalii]|uniref:NAD(P)/FAD-dependent oxidoreductase n=1 Tax=Tateyamaria omphalii TaxID=299262 RepID=UPI001672F324|nr:tryptophan 7-halogenase [Tateyamaria omphalii]GGX48264.1 alkylhalidase-like protein [Tateyamaria omphalii]
MTSVLIAGGGPAGLAAAIALAERKVPVKVVDPSGAATATRGELIAHGGAQIMQRLGLGHVLTDAVLIRDVVSHWGAAGLQSHGSHPGLGLHGWGLDRSALAKAMIGRAEQLGVTLHTGRITKSQHTQAGWTATTETPAGRETWHADYVIDATGRPAHIARRHAATVFHGPALVAVLWQMGSAQDTTMRAEATPEGWWYKVPHKTGGTVGFVTDAATAKRITAAPSVFLSQAQDSLSLISLKGISSRPWSMDCRSALLDQTSGTGWLAIGDAAAAFDPITSQGLFNALSAGFFAGNAAADALSGDTDAPRVYDALLAQTVDRTYATTHLQYAALPFDTPFWRHHARAGMEKKEIRPIHA